MQLAQTGAFRFLTAADVYAANRLVSNHDRGLSEAERDNFSQLIRDSGGDRGIDAIPASPDTPEEYGLVIANKTGSGIRYDQPDTTPDTLPILRELCAKKALIEGRDRPLLLKSPPDYPAGVACLEKAFPTARFILIHRHPLLTLQSQVRAWREIILRRNAYLALIDRGYHALFEDLGRRMRLGIFLHSEAGTDWLADCILSACQGFPGMSDTLTNRLFTIRYEDLCTGQASVFARLSAFLGTELPEPSQQPVPRAAQVHDEVSRAFSRRLHQFAPYLEYCGYGAEIV
jgi:hypothetical protein